MPQGTSTSLQKQKEGRWIIELEQIPQEGILLSTQPDLIRPVALRLLSLYVPSDTGDEHFLEIAKDYGGSGTTCGYLCHWLMWRLGCRDPKVVNRTDSLSGLKYVPGANISKIRFNSYFRVYDPANGYEGPDEGDIVFISNGPSNTEHVFCFLSSNGDEAGATWTSADAGQTNDAGRQCSRIKQRTWQKGGMLSSPTGSRRIQGWIPLTDLTLSTLATLDSPNMPDAA